MTSNRDIARAARAGSVLDAALAYSVAGLSVIPCRGKRCSLANWKAHQTRRADVIEVTHWHEAGLLENVAVVCGAVSGNLVVLDLDGDDAVEAFDDRFPGFLGSTYTVRTGSGHGLHAYVVCDDVPSTTRTIGSPVGNIEVRANGCYVVAPPSVHPATGYRYYVENDQPPLRLFGVDDIVGWVRRLQRQAAPPTGRTPVRPVQVMSGWAQAALAAECASVRHAPAGARNNTLNRAAFKLGQLIQRGLLSRDDVETSLYYAAAALAETDGAASVLRTIKSGLDAGMTKPIWRGEA